MVYCIPKEENTEHLCNIGLENKVIGNYWEQKYHDIWRWKFRFSNLAWNRKNMWLVKQSNGVSTLTFLIIRFPAAIQIRI
jgi:hypothetical protein